MTFYVGLRDMGQGTKVGKKEIKVELRLKVEIVGDWLKGRGENRSDWMLE